MLVALIMAGGRGERFWPKSREKLPKQFLDLTGEGTLLQLTAKRINRLVEWDKIYVIGGPDYVELIKEQLPQIPVYNIIVEPEGRNTAPCIGLGALHIKRRHPDAVMMVLPSDHYIQDEETFCHLLGAASRLADQGQNLVTIGLKPNRPETGYGYIQVGPEYDSFNGYSGHEVIRFVEKPDQATAKAYLASRDYLWNSGMFIWKVSTILTMFKQYMPDTYDNLQMIEGAWDTNQEQEILIQEFRKMEKTSIDYGIMEKADSIYVFPGDIGWDDVGCWTALDRINPGDADGNVLKGQVVAIGTKDCIIEGQGKLIATLGIESLVVVDTGDVLMICPKDQSGNLRKIVEKIREKGLNNYL